MAYVQTQAQAGSGASEPAAGLDVEMLASILQEIAKESGWLRALLTAHEKKRLQAVDPQMVAENFASFVSEHELSDSIAAMSRGHLVVAAIWLSYLLVQKGCGVRRPSDATALMLQKPSYIPVEAVGPSGQLHFASQALDALPRISPPRVCQLCGAGFLQVAALETHCGKAHGGYAEYRKRLFWEAERLPALALSPMRKRTMLANFCSAQLQCRPGGTGEAVPRGEAACVVCARKDWLESRFKCFLWKELPGGGAAEPTAQGGEGEQGAASDSEDEQPEQKRSLLRDADGNYYFGDPTLINALLGVEHYVKAMPSIPPEELHASSVQHPACPNYRWLLHTRRVPTEPCESQVQAAEAAPEGAPGGAPEPATSSRAIHGQLCRHVHDEQAGRCESKAARGAEGQISALRAAPTASLPRVCGRAHLGSGTGEPA